MLLAPVIQESYLDLAQVFKQKNQFVVQNNGYSPKWKIFKQKESQLTNF